ncbi:MAG: alpha/beta fold hydrolase [Chloroflexi bacterium]|jgi:medium-chain acyl-[acyl-carrier-protein] hydrolase|nr:alpha/beta fold hydrolase [Chloroflexota bacterium]
MEHEEKFAVKREIWLPYYEARSGARVRLFCFPCAGGSALMYRDWQENLPPAVEVGAVELPGHGLRMREAPLREMDALVAALLAGLSPHFDRPAVFFGHSMGALLAFELARALRAAGEREPAALLVSSHRAPQLPNPDRTNHTLSDRQLAEKIQRLGGTPQEVLEHPELLELILPTLRADFEVLDRYHYVDAGPFAFPIAAYGGIGDEPLPRAHLDAWREQTAGRFTLQMFPGGHFYLHDVAPLFLGTLSQTILRSVSGG